ncbi:hypothetical protein OIU74_028542 [Salix koriyanagi]|uniref:Uncharacterized protein n=1 Tax=Salix koriyanagi TaxID=2511006 RepID=A0A9Q0VE07_9ROSI|nr:hypothetical protein OIU74_028542 [Salix koriyanagi]
MAVLWTWQNHKNLLASTGSGFVHFRGRCGPPKVGGTMNGCGDEGEEDRLLMIKTRVVKARVVFEES